MVQYRRSTPRMEEGTMTNKQTLVGCEAPSTPWQPSMTRHAPATRSGSSTTWCPSPARSRGPRCWRSAAAPLRPQYRWPAEATTSCVELGDNFATIARGKLADYPQEAWVLASPFEDWPLEEEPFELVVSATGFHWVDPAIRYRKSAQALRPAGSLALIWNRPYPQGSSEGFPEALEDVHRREAPELAPERRPPRLDWEGSRQGVRDRRIRLLREA